MSYHPGFESVETTEQVPTVERFNYRDQKTVDAELKRLSWWKRFLLRWRGQVSVGLHQPDGFRGPMEFFLYLCENCGLILTYPQGDEGTIACETCRLKHIRNYREKSS